MFPDVETVDDLPEFNMSFLKSILNDIGCINDHHLTETLQGGFLINISIELDTFTIRCYVKCDTPWLMVISCDFAVLGSTVGGKPWEEFVADFYRLGLNHYANPIFSTFQDPEVGPIHLFNCSVTIASDAFKADTFMIRLHKTMAVGYIISDIIDRRFGMRNDPKVFTDAKLVDKDDDGDE